MQFITKSPEETERLGERLGRTLHGGEVIAYLGDLGAGKTAFVRGAAECLPLRQRGSMGPSCNIYFLGGDFYTIFMPAVR